MSAAPCAGVMFRVRPLAVACQLALLFSGAASLIADEPADLREQLHLLQQQNASLQEQLQKQQQLIDNLTRKVGEIQQTSSEHDRELADLKADSNALEKPASSSGFGFGNVHIGGEGGVAFFDSGKNGIFPNSEFRVDEAKLFVDAAVWEDVYAFAELNLAQREYDELELHLGEFYVDFESVSRLWGRDSQLSVRAGRMDIPFGEEYMRRDAIDNPLISHSLSDFWGVDEGIEIYGSLGKVSYVLAVQNAGVSGTRDFDSDKSVAARVSFDPTHRLHFSVSAMRTGNLDAADDMITELWIGNGWFRSIGTTNTTKFHANLVQADASLKFSRGQFHASGGYARYDDNDPARDNQRDIWFYSVEGVCHVTKKFYAAARFSQMFCDNGYPLPGNGDQGYYFWNPFGPLSEELWRLSLGVGYRFSDHLLIKTEYSFERGSEASGADREDVDLFAVEAAFKF